MYKYRDQQIAFDDFNQSCGMQLDMNNRWIILGDTFPWSALEDGYAELFPSVKGNPAKPLRMALGALLIQKQKGCSDRQLVKEIAESPYLQYFIGLQKFQNTCPFTAPALVSFRKRLNAERF